jgi:hypothetical protein
LLLAPGSGAVSNEGQEDAELSRLLATVFAAAALILARCKTANPPAPAAQYLPDLALQNGHVKEMGLVGKTLGIAFA